MSLIPLLPPRPLPFSDRERNKTHARKTRERKKTHMIALKARILDLEKESASFRNKVDARYTASVLLGLSQHPEENGVRILNSNTVCSASDKATEEQGLKMLQKQQERELNTAAAFSDIDLAASAIDAVTSLGGSSKVKKRTKYSPHEREVVRRERNRIHAKKTRDKKKLFLESSEKVIENLEKDVQLLRNYMLSCNLISKKEVECLCARDDEARRELVALKDNCVGTAAVIRRRQTGDCDDDEDGNGDRYEYDNEYDQNIDDDKNGEDDRESNDDYALTYAVGNNKGCATEMLTASSLSSVASASSVSRSLYAMKTERLSNSNEGSCDGSREGSDLAGSRSSGVTDCAAGSSGRSSSSDTTGSTDGTSDCCNTSSSIRNNSTVAVTCSDAANTQACLTSLATSRPR